MAANSKVAQARPSANSTAQREAEERNSGATTDSSKVAKLPMTGRELREQLKAQHGRNGGATHGQTVSSQELRSDVEKPVGVGPDGSATERRRGKALALLTANPQWQRAVVAEVGDPVIVGTAIRGLGYRELEIPTERYDVPALLELLDKYGQSQTVH